MTATVATGTTQAPQAQAPNMLGARLGGAYSAPQIYSFTLGNQTVSVQTNDKQTINMITDIQNLASEYLGATALTNGATAQSPQSVAGSAVSGGVSGAASGAATGGPVGAAIGGVAGAAGGALGAAMGNAAIGWSKNQYDTLIANNDGSFEQGMEAIFAKYSKLVDPKNQKQIHDMAEVFNDTVSAARGMMNGAFKQAKSYQERFDPNGKYYAGAGGQDAADLKLWDNMFPGASSWTPGGPARTTDPTTLNAANTTATTATTSTLQLSNLTLPTIGVTSADLTQKSTNG